MSLLSVTVPSSLVVGGPEASTRDENGFGAVTRHTPHLTFSGVTARSVGSTGPAAMGTMTVMWCRVLVWVH